MTSGPRHAMGVRNYTVAAAVTEQHRGHRLGLLVKAAMLEWLAETEPAIELIETGNASANDHMIAVNDTLGFAVDPPEFHTVELAVAGTALT